MNLYRVVHKRGKKVIDERTLGAFNAYDADARANFQLEQGDATIVYDERGRQCFRHAMRRKNKTNYQFTDG